jgi:hypothetical protein
MSLQKEYEINKQYILQELNKLKVSTAKLRVLEMIDTAHKIVELGGQTDIPYRQLEGLIKNSFDVCGDDFARFCHRNDIPITYDVSPLEGDEYRGYYGNEAIHIKLDLELK